VPGDAVWLKKEYIVLNISGVLLPAGGSRLGMGLEWAAASNRLELAS
jgi:hypothetical protein